MTTERKDLVSVGVLWAVLTALGEWAVLTTNLAPTLASKQGEETDKAIELLFIYSVPVMAVVLAVLIYTLVRWRVSEPSEDGPPIADHRGFSRAWFWISVALATLVFLHPGLTGIFAMAQEEEIDLIVELDGVQWHWDVAFPEQGVTMENPAELVLPVGTTIRFDITSSDVIHAFWVPAFRLKQDAIPGQMNSLTITLLENGDFADDDGFRLQCAELCGTGHARMFLPVRVVEQDEFDDWLANAGGPASMDGMDMTESTEIDMTEDEDMDMTEDTQMDMGEDGDMDMTEDTQMDMTEDSDEG
ncbi:MAG TPA: cytochrome c oxidase subunit II [Actinobacteria bacterium]|nr:cytochrome c oxidase subunit II [Actinomycetota bacterium]